MVLVPRTDNATALVDPLTPLFALPGGNVEIKKTPAGEPTQHPYICNTDDGLWAGIIATHNGEKVLVFIKVTAIDSFFTTRPPHSAYDAYLAELVDQIYPLIVQKIKEHSA